MIRSYYLNPTLKEGEKCIREGRCMQKASSWATAWPPITLATLAAIGKSYGPVRLLDGNVEPVSLEELIQDIRAFHPDLIILNTAFPSIDNDMTVASKIKSAFPGTKILGFGVYFTLLEQEAMALHPFLDYVVMGEPEGTFEDLLRYLSGGKIGLEAIAGLGHRDSTGPHLNAKRDFLQHLDQLPYPDRDILKNDRYRLPHNGKTYTLINVARGCPYPCIYCIVTPYYGRLVRKHSVDYVMNEIRLCQEKYRIEEFLFWEEVFTLDRNYALALCDGILKNNFQISWAATTRVGLVDQELLKRMKEAGCHLLGLGIESGCQEILNAAKKKQTVKEIRRAVLLCKKIGIKTMGHFIFGLPGETRESAKKTIRFMLSLGLDYMQSYSAVPYPKTEFGTLARQEGWIEAQRWSQFDFGGPSIVNSKTLTAREVSAFRQEAFRRFYFRPLFLWRNLKTILSPANLSRLLKFTDWMKPKKHTPV